MVSGFHRDYQVVRRRVNINEGKTDRDGNPLSPCYRDITAEINPRRVWRAQQDTSPDSWVVLEFDSIFCDQAKRVFVGSKEAAEAFADRAGR
jgi:hypothetical protein